MNELAGVDVALLGAALAYGAALAARAGLALRSVRADEAALGAASEPEPTDVARGAPPAGPEGAQTDAALEPLVTVLQPILGGDPALEEVLRDTLEQAPPWTRFRWLVDEPDAAGRDVAARLAARDARVVVELCPTPRSDENPKVMKLARALPTVDTPFVAVLDDDTVAGRAIYVAALSVLGPSGAEPPSAALYTGFPSYDAQPGFAGGLLAHFVNDQAPAAYLATGRWAPATSLNGMFYVARTEDLRALDAFERIRGELCDDYALARLARSAGWRIHQGATALRIRTSLDGLAEYRAQLHRWLVFALVLLRDLPVARRLALGVWLGAPPLLLLAVVAGMGTGRVGAEVGVATIVVRHFALGALQRRVLGSRPGPPPDRSLALSLLAELALPFHALHAALVPTIRWRSRTIRVGRDGRYRELVPGDGGGA